MKLYLKKKIEIYNIRDQMGSEEEVRRVAVLLTPSRTQGSCLLSLGAKDDSRDSLFSLPVAGTWGYRCSNDVCLGN